jgi:3-dehydroquinate dehydratase II
MPKPIFVLNGPNLNLLGVREPELYGRETLEDIQARCEKRAKDYGFEIEFLQSNYEGKLIESIHEARDKASGIVINPAGLSFGSIPLLDALKTFDGPKIEVHITNIHKRESVYQKSLVSMTATGVIAGLGSLGYLLAIEAVAAAVSSGLAATIDAASR